MLKRSLAAVAGLALSLSIATTHAAETLRVSAIPDEAPTELIRKFKPLGEYLVHRAFPGKAALIFRKKYSESRNP